ncbi:MAG: ribonuclease Z [Planctomycetaceae bacterium]|nr:MAG: ribonuclease Z [Planctomycetaceae bacterium]
MDLHCLGTAGYHPSERRHTSCYFLPGDGVVLDAGTGMFRLPPLIRTPTLDILLSHAHLDHVVGLTFLHNVLRQRPVDEIRVWGEAHSLAAIREHLFAESIFPAPIPVRWENVTPGQELQIGSGGRILVEPRSQRHPGGSVGYRLRWPEAGEAKSLIYATDTDGDDSAAARRWMAGADLLMHECSFRDSEQEWAIKTGHCWPTRVAKIARDAEVRRLLLTHLGPLEPDDDPVGIAAARLIFPEVSVAADGDRIEF